jgi:hypothetical protein
LPVGVLAYVERGTYDPSRLKTTAKSVKLFLFPLYGVQILRGTPNVMRRKSQFYNRFTDLCLEVNHICRLPDVF